MSFQNYAQRNLKVGIIGTGKFGGALAHSLASEHEVWLLNRTKEKAEAIAEEIGAHVAKDFSELARNSDVIIVAVKPKDIDVVLEQLRELVNSKLVISIAAGVRISHLEEKLGSSCRVVRCMPNLGLTCGEGAVGYALGKLATDEDEKIVREIFGSSGVCLRVDNEAQLDAVTGVSGSGIGFMAAVIDAIVQAGVAEGLSPQMASLLIAQSAIGAGKLVLQGTSTEDIAAAVTSKDGTTARGWDVWRSLKLSEQIGMVVHAAVARSREMGATPTLKSQR